MATSINIPALSHAIRTDIPAINEVLKALAKNDPSALADLESGTKRIVEGSSGWEIQQLNGANWSTLSSFNIDAQKVGGFQASALAVKNTIPVRDANGAIPGDITGKAGSADKLNSTLAVNAGGTGATTPEDARNNLGVPPTSHASPNTTHGESSASNYGHSKASSTTPKALGTASAGSETASFARGDHVHPTTTATDKVLGMVNLSDSTTSILDVSTGTAATPAAVKAAYDKALEAIDNANSIQGDIGNVSDEVDQLAQDILDASSLSVANSEGTTDVVSPVLGTIQHEMGAFWISLDGSIPTGGLPYLGHLCQRATYGDFWPWCESNKNVVTEEAWQAYANEHNGCCPYYSFGDGSTTFRTPKYDQSFLKVVASLSEASAFEKPGLPDHNHLFPSTQSFYYSYQGADSFLTTRFVADSDSPEKQLPNAMVNSLGNASEVNSVYGNSDTVTPQNFSIIVGVYAVSAVSAPIGTTDAASILNAVSRIESTTVKSVNGQFPSSGNVTIDTGAHVVETGRYEDNSMWYRIWNDGWLEQGGTYGGAGTSTIITLLVAFSEPNYTIVLGEGTNTAASSDTEGVDYAALASNKSETSFRVSKAKDRAFGWYACGQRGDI